MSSTSFTWGKNLDLSGIRTRDLWVSSRQWMCECCFMLQLVKHVHAKFQLSSFYPDGLRQIALEVSKFQNFEYEVHQSSPNDEGEPKFQIFSPLVIQHRWRHLNFCSDVKRFTSLDTFFIRVSFFVNAAWQMENNRSKLVLGSGAPSSNDS
jgi:hypothetical protein